MADAIETPVDDEDLYRTVTDIFRYKKGCSRLTWHYIKLAIQFPRTPVKGGNRVIERYTIIIIPLIVGSTGAGGTHSCVRLRVDM